jgi:hypothetical protein
MTATWFVIPRREPRDLLFADVAAAFRAAPARDRRFGATRRRPRIGVRAAWRRARPPRKIRNNEPSFRGPPMHPESTLVVPAALPRARAGREAFARRPGAMAVLPRGIVGPH